MPLKRYSTEELKDKCKDIFYQYLSSVNSDSYDCPTPAHVLHQGYENKLEQYLERIKLYKEKLDSPLPSNVKTILDLRLKFLRMGAEHLAFSCKDYQKELYDRTGSTEFARSTIRIPLDKKINSYYDDLTFEVAFYDDVCTIRGKFCKYQKLRTNKERLQFVKDNTEITHMSLLFIKNNRPSILIPLIGKLNNSDPRVMLSGITFLSESFSDFNKLTLKDTSAIRNNDVKQFMQTKIDLDKEAMKVLASQVIRGDKYSIHQTPPNQYGRADLYIRYTCRSTGRVYYNKLNIENLEISEFFEGGNYDSYIKSWWNLNTLGGNPDNDTPVIRC